LDFQLILGEELCLHAEILFNRDGFQVRKSQLEVSDLIGSQNDLMNIDVVENKNELNINEQARMFAKNEIRKMINNYEPLHL